MNPFRNDTTDRSADGQVREPVLDGETEARGLARKAGAAKRPAENRMPSSRADVTVRAPDAPCTVTTLIDELLAEQRQLTAVERFSQRHANDTTPLLESHYRDLIPLTAPRPGEQYAFEVDLDRCSGCKGCVTACHSLNGLDEDEAWRDVGFLVGEAIVPLQGGRRAEAHSANAKLEHRLLAPATSSRFGSKVIPLQVTVTTACHHCVEPGCLLGCPVLAYDKDPATGIVRHLDDQCIGCSYCILKCPYEVPKYSARRGIVRKCDLCHGRLAEGEAPACVQACPNQAIRIALVKPAEVAKQSRTCEAGSRNDRSTSGFALPTSHFNGWLPDAPSPAITLPTTRYLTTKPAELLRAADHCNPKPAHAHWPLVLMLVLTQAGIGGLLITALAKFLPLMGEIAGESAGDRPSLASLATVSFALLSGGLLASVFHLGQPKKAWRVWLGWRTSWLSREAIALNTFAGAATAALAILWADNVAQATRLPASLAALLHWAGGAPALLWAAPLGLSGLLAIFAQAMVYADTQRHFWQLRFTGPRFLGSTVVLGSALALLFTPSASLAAVLALATLVKLAAEITVLKHADTDSDRWTQLRRTASLQREVLRPVLGLRLLLGLFGGVFLPFTLAVGALPPAFALLAFAVCLLGELAERYLFFTSVAPDKMPGMP